MAHKAPDEQPEKQPEQDKQPEQESKPGRQPLSPAARKRAQKMFEHGSKQSSQDQFDYANELLSQCVVADPANLQYAQTFLGNLRKKYKNNRKGSSLAQFKERGARSGIKKAISSEAWDDVFKHGVAVLRVNPWDIPALTGMAEAAKQVEARETELFYLKSALESDPKNVEVNKLCAKALEERGQFDQAIACLRRAEQAQPDDEETQRWIGDITVRKTIKAGDWDRSDPTKKSKAQKGGEEPAEEEVSQEERLRQRMRQDPKNLTNYFELAQVFLNDDRFDDAEKVFDQALKISGGDVEVREKWEDVRLRRVRAQAAEARMHREESKEAEAVYEQKRKKLHEEELMVAKNRVERYPGQLRFKYDLGVRYQIDRNYTEAIKQYQAARNDPRVKGICLLRLGQCFQQIKQYRLALSHYASAITEIPDREAENKKEALLLAGKVSLYLKDIEAAERYLTAVAGMDFTYKDVSELLDRIATIHESGGVVPDDAEAPKAEEIEDEPMEEEAGG